jgi:hypothetical protein
MMPNAPLFIKKALLADAGFAFASGLICALAAAPLSQLMGLSDPIYLTILGIVLVLYSIDLALVALKAAHKTLFLKLFFAADIAWIMASVVLLVGFSHWFSLTGMILIDVAALAVAGFAASKYKGLQMMKRAPYQPA